MKAITDAHVLFAAMADSCSSSSSEEDHVILLGALAVLQQIDDEYNTEKTEDTKKMVGSPMFASCSAHFML